MDEERDWLPGLTLSLDPDAIEDYEMEFTRWLRGETLSSVEVAAVNCTAALRGAIVDTLAVVRVQSVAAGASVTVSPVSSTGRRNDFTINFRPKQQ